MGQWKKLLTLSLALAIVIAVGGSAAAVESGGLGGRPANPDPANPRSTSIFIFSLEGGQSKRDAVTVANNRDTPTVVSLYAADGLATNTGSFTCKQGTEERSEAGAWLALEQSEIELAPHTQQNVSFTLKVPADTAPGEYNACVVLQDKNDPGEQTGAVNLHTRSAVRVAVTVPGDLTKALRISDFRVVDWQARRHTYKLALANDGNVSADANVRVTLKSALTGRTVFSMDGDYPALPGRPLELRFANDKLPFWGGLFKAEVSVRYDAQPGVFGTEASDSLQTLTARRIMVFVLPSWPAIVIILTVLIVLLWLVIRLKARGRSSKAQPAPRTGKKGKKRSAHARTRKK